MAAFTNNIKDWYIKAFREFESSINGQSKTKFHNIRKNALDKFSEIGFPTAKNEEWKYSDPASVLKYNFETEYNRHNNLPVIDKGIKELVSKLSAKLIVFVNGQFSPELSDTDIKEDIIIESLADALKKYPEIINEHFTKHASIDNGFNALNTAFAHDGAFIHVKKGSIINAPVYILYLGGNDGKNLVNYPRNIFYAEESSRVTIIENFWGISSNPYLTNSVTEIIAEENSVIDIYKLLQEDINAFHISKTQAHLSRNASFSHMLISSGGSFVRNDLNAMLNGEGIESHYNGLYLTDGSQHIDNHTLADHAMPHCVSNETYKGILGGRSRGVFNGKIIVRPGAQKTNAYQSNKNIILTKEALMNTKPQLEIFADDVRCTHGATVGQLEDEQIFYLRARGIDEAMARNMLIHAFAEDVIDMIKPEPLREYASKFVFKRLHGDTEQI